MNNKLKYIDKYNKSNYKMYQFRVKRGTELEEYLSKVENRNKFIVQAIENHLYTLTIKEIKDKSKPLFDKWNIKEVYLFGSYSRGEANKDSDVDFYCDKGNVRSLFDLSELSESLKENLGKDVDIVLFENKVPAKLLDNIKKDMIRLFYIEEM